MVSVAFETLGKEGFGIVSEEVMMMVVVVAELCPLEFVW